MTKKLLIMCCGGVAAGKLHNLIQTLMKKPDEWQVRVVVTEPALRFLKLEDLGDVEVFQDRDEWSAWKTIGDPVIHIDLRNWADVAIIVPLDADNLAKIANGMCDNLLLCVARAWEFKKRIFFCPAMDSGMWHHPITAEHIDILKSWGYEEISPVLQKQACVEDEVGSMVAVQTVVQKLNEISF